MEYNFNVPYPYAWNAAHPYIASPQHTIQGGLPPTAVTTPTAPPAIGHRIPVQTVAAVMATNFHLNAQPTVNQQGIPGFGAGIFLFGNFPHGSAAPPQPPPAPAPVSQYGLSWNYGFNNIGNNANNVPSFNAAPPNQQPSIMQQQGNVACNLNISGPVIECKWEVNELTNDNVSNGDQVSESTQQELSDKIAAKVTNLLSDNVSLKNAIYSKMQNTDSVTSSHSKMGGNGSSDDNNITTLKLLSLDTAETNLTSGDASMRQFKFADPSVRLVYLFHLIIK